MRRARAAQSPMAAATGTRGVHGDRRPDDQDPATSLHYQPRSQ